MHINMMYIFQNEYKFKKYISKKLRYMLCYLFESDMCTY